MSLIFSLLLGNPRVWVALKTLFSASFQFYYKRDDENKLITLYPGPTAKLTCDEAFFFLKKKKPPDRRLLQSRSSNNFKVTELRKYLVLQFRQNISFQSSQSDFQNHFTMTKEKQQNNNMNTKRWKGSMLKLRHKFNIWDVIEGQRVNIACKPCKTRVFLHGSYRW